MHPTYMVEQEILAQRLQVVLSFYRPIGLNIYALHPDRHTMSERVSLLPEFLTTQFAEAGAGL